MRVGRRLFYVAACVLGTLGCAPGALADQQVQGRPVDSFSGDATIDQGEALTFMNADLNNHDVTADAPGPDGKPLFASATVGFGQTVPVEGAQYLTSGDYPFHCTIHPFMKATLHVTSNGSPKPRPGSAGGSGGGTAGGSAPPAQSGTTAPAVKLTLGKIKMNTLRKTHKLPVKVTVNQPASLNLTALIGKTKIATGKVAFTAAGTKSVTLKLSRAGRKAIRGKRKVNVTLNAVSAH